MTGNQVMARRDLIRFLYATLDNVACEQVVADGVPVGWVHRAKAGLPLYQVP
ncbi:MAG: hypothetical protein NTW87_36325 [Planctomycetota bacterium]|nr:hypothetical protein [Planctomycetota bacterium]